MVTRASPPEFASSGFMSMASVRRTRPNSVVALVGSDPSAGVPSGTGVSTNGGTVATAGDGSGVGATRVEMATALGGGVGVGPAHAASRISVTAIPDRADAMIATSSPDETGGDPAQ
jgi:hypothetical protein